MTQPEIITNQELAAKYVELALQEPEKVINTQAPASNLVDLPGGFIDKNEIVKTVEVRELNGEDEEIIAKAGGSGKALQTLLVRGTVAIGDRTPVKEDFDRLLAGDRDSIILGIRIATYGETETFEVSCSSCSLKQDVVVNLQTDIPTVKLDDPIKDRNWDVELRSNVVNISLPNGLTQKKLLDNADKTYAELNTLLLAGCINSVDNRAASPTTALQLGVLDREMLLDEIVSRNPGPRLLEVVKACEACGEDIALPLSLANLFRF